MPPIGSERVAVVATASQCPRRTSYGAILSRNVYFCIGCEWYHFFWNGNTTVMAGTKVTDDHQFIYHYRLYIDRWQLQESGNELGTSYRCSLAIGGWNSTWQSHKVSSVLLQAERDTFHVVDACMHLLYICRLEWMRYAFTRQSVVMTMTTAGSSKAYFKRIKTFNSVY